MRAEERGGRDAAGEPEDDVQAVEHEHDEGVRKVLVPRGRDEVEEGDHAEDADEHVVVYARRVVVEGRGDHVADEGHDEQGPEELEASKLFSHTKVSTTRILDPRQA